MTLSIPTRPSSHLGVGHRPCGGERSGCRAMTSSSKIRSRAAAHPRALARSPAGTDPPLVTEQATPRPVPLHRSLALQVPRSEEHMSVLQSLMRISYAVFGLEQKQNVIYL